MNRIRNNRGMLWPDKLNGKVGYLLAIVIITQSLYPFTDTDSVVVGFLFSLLYTGFVVAGIFLVRHSAFYLRLLMVLGGLWVIMVILFTINPDDLLISLAAYVVFGVYQSAVVWVLLLYIFRTSIVTLDVLFAASAVYLLLGAMFVPVYGLIETTTFLTSDPANPVHAFSDPQANPDEPIPWQNFVYYSYSTLTTLGYGDVLPITSWARSVASMEAIVGVLYLTVILARLVGLYAAQEEAPIGV